MMTDEEYNGKREAITREAMVSYPENLKVWLDKFESARDAGDWTAAAQAMGYVSSQARHIAFGAVNLAKFEGATWDEIGEKLNITKQAAQQRFGKAFREKDW